MTTTLTVLRGEGDRLDAEVTRTVVEQLNHDKTTCLFVGVGLNIDLSHIGFNKNNFGEYRLNMGNIRKYVRVASSSRDLNKTMCGFQFNLVVAKNLGECDNLLYILSRLRSGSVVDLDFILLLEDGESVPDASLEKLLPKSGQANNIVRVDGKWVLCDNDFGIRLKYLEY